MVGRPWGSTIDIYIIYIYIEYTYIYRIYIYIYIYNKWTYQAWKWTWGWSWTSWQSVSAWENLWQVNAMRHVRCPNSWWSPGWCGLVSLSGTICNKVSGLVVETLKLQARREWFEHEKAMGFGIHSASFVWCFLMFCWGVRGSLWTMKHPNIWQCVEVKTCKQMLLHCILCSMKPSMC